MGVKAMILVNLQLKAYPAGGKLSENILFRIYINRDCGGSNDYRKRMWKYQLQQFADRTGLEIEVSQFPPGTSKWNKNEHRLFCYITKNWQGKPLVDIQTADELIGSTTTTTGLEVICVREDSEYQLAKKVSDDEFDSN
jgi:hypothetical protein